MEISETGKSKEIVNPKIFEAKEKLEIWVVKVTAKNYLKFENFEIWTSPKATKIEWNLKIKIFQNLEGDSFVLRLPRAASN